MMLNELFRVLATPGYSVPDERNWHAVINSLLATTQWDCSLRLAEETLTRQIPSVIRASKSVQQLCAVGQSVFSNASLSWHCGLHAFTVLDTVMVDWCKDPVGMHGATEESVQAWRRLRERFISSTHDHSKNGAPLRLPQHYFDTLPGHGSLQRFAVGERKRQEG